MTQSKLIEEIQQLKQEKNAVILAHYYLEDDVQSIADYIGDSYYLSEIATKVPQQVIVFCGVSFMGESAKILNPEKTVLLPDPTADCPMAHMVTAEKILKMRAQYQDDLAVVCYINSTAELKQYADVCVTSANAMKIVRNLPQKYIYFIPDENLGRFVAKQVPEKQFIFNDGYCPVHVQITGPLVQKAKAQHPEALVLAHPECTPEVLEQADYIGSTSGIIKQVTESAAQQFIIATEIGVLYQICQKCPEKQCFPVFPEQICPDMRKVTLEKVAAVLRTFDNQVTLERELADKAMLPLQNMLELARKD